MSSSLPTSVDVIVVGSGITGMSAAITAAHHGRSVVVLEQAKYLGGTSAVSGGWLWVPGNKKGAAEGDTREAIESYIKAIAQDGYNPELVGGFLDAVPEAMAFFEDNTDMEFVYADMAPDYQMTSPGAREHGRAVTVVRVDGRTAGKDRRRIQPYLSTITVFGYMPEIGKDLATVVQASYKFKAFVYLGWRIAKTWMQKVLFGRTLNRSNGNAIITRMVSTAHKLNIPLLTNRSVTELVTDEAGRVTGVRLADGAVVTANRGVILASGGFAGNPELRKQYFPHDRAGGNHTTPTVGQIGSSIKLGQQVGAVVDTTPHQAGPWGPVTTWRNLRGQDRVFPHLRNFGLPGLIAVNEDGIRFANESYSYHDFCREMLKANEGKEHFHAWLVGDHRAVRRYGLGPVKPFPVPTWYYRAVVGLKKSRTIAGLAQQIGVPAGALEATIAEFNEGAARGEDPKFQRGSTKFHHFKGDMAHKPNPNLAELKKAPYYAIKISMGDLGSFAGLAVDGSARVLNAQGTPIPGLYAGGTAAVSVFGGGYPGFGSNLGPGLVQGYLAARELSTD